MDNTNYCHTSKYGCMLTSHKAFAHHFMTTTPFKDQKCFQNRLAWKFGFWKHPFFCTFWRQDPLQAVAPCIPTGSNDSATHKASQERPYNNDSTTSLLLSEVKHYLAQLVLRWGTTLESWVLFFCYFPLPAPKTVLYGIIPFSLLYCVKCCFLSIC